MAQFSDVLLTVDFDRTLTARDSTIPQKNLEAIDYFIRNGGAFTINTGRSLPMCAPFLGKVNVSAPLLLYNGAAAYDLKTRSFVFEHTIPRGQGKMVREIMSLLQDEILEIQGKAAHYTFSTQPAWEKLYDSVGCAWGYIEPEGDVGELLKLSICGPIRELTIDSLFCAPEALEKRYDALEATLRETYGGIVDVVRPAANIIDMQVRGANKGRSARELKAQLKRKILVCVGDAPNDIPMLDAADYAYCPQNSIIAGQYETVCDCDEGAVAEVIFEKIPQING